MDYTDLLASITPGDENSTRIAIPESWMQGRTAYGGLTAALCLETARALAPGIPVRTAQIAFVGPVSGTVTCKPEVLRKGKNTVFVSVRMIGEEGVLADCIFTFGASRQSAFDFANIPAPDVPEPEDVEPYFRNHPGPAFAQHFDLLIADGARPISGAEKADASIWMRHKDTRTPSDPVSLLALADIPSPAVMAMFTQPGRISSMTWMAEFLTEDIQTDARWFLARHTAQTARYGYSSQEMLLWNKKREPVMIGRQTIAVFA